MPNLTISDMTNVSALPKNDIVSGADLAAAAGDRAALAVARDREAGVRVDPARTSISARRLSPLGSAAMTVRRLEPYAVTIFAEMSALAARIGAVNLGQGFPDEDGPPAMLKVAENAIAEGIDRKSVV